MSKNRLLSGKEGIEMTENKSSKAAAIFVFASMVPLELWSGYWYSGAYNAVAATVGWRQISIVQWICLSLIFRFATIKQQKPPVFDAEFVGNWVGRHAVNPVICRCFVALFLWAMS